MITCVYIFPDGQCSNYTRHLIIILGEKKKRRRHISYPIDLRVLQQELHDLRVTSSGCEVQRGAELTVQQVRITVPFLQQQLGCLDFAVPEERERTNATRR